VTAQSVTQAAADWGVSHWIVSGGGIRNRVMMRYLQTALGPQAVLQTPDAWGIPSEAKEALAFALLAAATLGGMASNVPSVTGARQAMVLGSITPRPNSPASALTGGTSRVSDIRSAGEGAGGTIRHQP
jgi:anhydro-N-acetylmuramic acid kinase